MHSNVRVRTVRTLFSSAAAAALCVGSASADATEDNQQVQNELREMRELVLQLQDQMSSQQEEIDSQKVVIREAGLEAERSSLSALSSFLETTEFSGSVATSYFYNTNDPGSSPRGGPAGFGGNTWGGTANPFHPDHNSIQFDELWLSARREASDESRVGFGFDIVYGALGEINGNAGGGGGNGLWISNAYIEYASPFFGIDLTAGKFGTHIGYEVAGAAYNANITRGFTYQSFQPVSQIGVKLSGELGPVNWMIGTTNGLGENQVDIDGAKDFIWSLGGGNDVISLNFAGEFGGDAEFFGGASGDNAMVLDYIIEFTPSEAITAWVDLTYAVVFEDGGADPWGIGLSAASRVAIGDRAGVTGRFEYGHGNDSDGAGTVAAVFMPGGGTETDAISLTGTLDYLLADGLTAKFEVKWDQILSIEGATDRIFASNRGDGPQDDQVLVGAQLVYAF